MPDRDPLAWLESLEGVPTAFAGTRDGIDVLLRDRGLRKTRPEQTTDSLLVGAAASAALDDSTSDLAAVRAGTLDAPAAAAVRVSTELLSLVPVVEHSPMQAFARLHALAGKGDEPDESLGRPTGAEAADRLATLSQTMLDTSVPALMLAAIAHAEIVTAAPFASRNGIVARAAERLIIAARGVDPKSLVATELGHSLLRAEYESNLRGYRDGGRAGLHSWLLYCAEAYTKAAEASPLAG